MLNFLFWNINRQPLQNSICRIVHRHDVDFIILAESIISELELFDCLNGPGHAEYKPTNELCDKVKIYSRFSEKYSKAKYENDRITIRQINLPNRLDILLVALHLPSKLNTNEDSQIFEGVKLTKRINDAESKVGHSRTILLGDFNMNPFEVGVVSAGGLHSVMSRDVAMRGSRHIQKEQYTFFYNPMWGFLGDNSPGPAGTYYYTASRHKEYFWNMFDQVMVRPSLVGRLQFGKIRILDSDGQKSLMTSSGRPDKKHASDHLPLLFQIDLSLRGKLK